MDISKSKTISKEEFESWVKDSKEDILGPTNQEVIVQGVVELSDKDLTNGIYRFRKFTFESEVYINNINITSSLIFENCKFQSILNINGCKFGLEKSANKRFVNPSLGFHDCSFGDISFMSSNFPSGVRFNGSEGEPCIIQNFRFHEVQLRNGLDIDECEILGQFEIFKGKFEYPGIFLSNIKIYKHVTISADSAEEINISGKNTEFLSPAEISGHDINNFKILNASFKKDLFINFLNAKKLFVIVGCDFGDIVQISQDRMDPAINHSLEEFNILDCKFRNGLEVTNKFYPIKSLSITFSEISSGVIDIREGNFNEVDLKGNNFNNSVFFRDCSYDFLTITHLFNKSLISFNNNKPKEGNGTPSELRIQNSNLGNTEFYDFDFSLYPTIRIIDSRIDNIFFNGVEWFEPEQLQVDESENDPKKILSQKREIYRQLKLASEKQSDRITALEFKAKEVETHRLFLELGNVKKADRWAILAGTTNNHGQDWIRPLLLILGISLIFFPILFYYADPEIGAIPDLSNEGFHYFGRKVCEHLAVLPQLFNPTRRISDLFPEIEKFSFGVYFFDGLHRILLAFFIFQIVSAFRKFVK